MEAVVSSPIMENNRFQINRKAATNVLCARTLPKQWRESMAATTARHHTYPRTTPPKRTGISCSDEPSPPTCKLATERSDRTTTPGEQSDAQHNGFNVNNNVPNKSNGVVKLKGSLAREVADAWEYRVGPSDQPASADRVQSIFNDIELYPTKNQVFEMLVCARECARRKSLTLTFGEFCFFAAKLRRCSRQTRQTSNKSEPWSQEWTVDKEPKEKDTTCKHLNGSEASPPPPPPCEVFLGGSCNPTTWRSDIAIPMLNRMGITYYNPQVEDWSMELVEVEHRAKAAARALLFVLDCETRAVAASVEVAHLAAAPRDLLLVLRPYTRHQTLGHEVITDQEYLELARARATLQEAVERRGLPAFTDIPAALRCAGAVLRGARTHPRHMFGHTILRLKRAFDAAGGRNARLPRARAVDTLRDVTGSARDLADRSLPHVDAVDFETFCVAVAELAADAESETRNGTNSSGESHSTEGASSARARDANGLYNNRLRAYGRKLRLHIPKNCENRSSRAECSAVTSTPGSSERAGASEGGEGGVFTPGTERRLQRLPSMLQHKYDVYLSGTFPTNGTRPEEMVRREGLSCVAPRANDYTRMFSAPARRSAPAPPDKPRHDKKPRPSPPTDDAHHRDQSDDAVQLRERSAAADPGDRLSASDFYKVSEDITPQPFKGTYDEELLLRSRILLFAMSSEAPCFCTLVLAAHYLGLRPAHTVLLIQPMQYRPDGPYSEAAVKDYNRGRHYLRDLALRANVPVFDSTDAALACVLATLRRGDV